MTKTFESIVKLLAEGDESLFVSKRKPTNMATSSPADCGDFARAVTPTPDSPSQLSLQALVFELGDDHTPKDRVKDITSQVINMLHQDGLARKQLGSLGNELAECCNSKGSFLRIHCILSSALRIQCGIDDSNERCSLELAEALCHLTVRKVIVSKGNAQRNLEYDFATCESLAYVETSCEMIHREFSTEKLHQVAATVGETRKTKVVLGRLLDVLSHLGTSPEGSTTGNPLQRYYFAPALCLLDSFVRGKSTRRRREIIAALATRLLSNTEGEVTGHDSTASPFEVQLCSSIICRISQEEFDTIVVPKLKFKLLSDPDSTTVTIFAIVRVFIDSSNSSTANRCLVNLRPHFDVGAQLMTAATRQLLSPDPKCRGLGSDLLVSLIIAASASDSSGTAILSSVKVISTNLVKYMQSQSSQGTFAVRDAEQMEAVLLTTGEVGKTYMDLMGNFGYDVSDDIDTSDEERFSRYILESVDYVSRTSDTFRGRGMIKLRRASEYTLDKWEKILHRSGGVWHRSADVDKNHAELPPPPNRLDDCYGTAAVAASPCNGAPIGTLEKLERDAIAKGRTKGDGGRSHRPGVNLIRSGIPNSTELNQEHSQPPEDISRKNIYCTSAENDERRNLVSADPQTQECHHVGGRTCEPPYRRAYSTCSDNDVFPSDLPRNSIQSALDLEDKTETRSTHDEVSRGENRPLRPLNNRNSTMIVSPGVVGDTPMVMEEGTTEEALPMAVAITQEDEEEVFIESAEEYDPSTKPSLLKNRKFIAGSVCCLVVAIAVAISVSFTVTNKYVAGQANQQPLCIKDSKGYFEVLSQISSEEALCMPLSPQFYAYHWISDSDARAVLPSDPRLIQRYVLAVIYLSTKWYNWVSCGGRENTTTCRYQCWGDDCLHAKSCDANNVCTTFRYLSSASECSWYGSTCDSKGRLVSLHLLSNNLDGTLPPEISSLTSLISLSVADNYIKGTIPQSIESLTNLLELILRFNGFTGTVPSGIYSLPKIRSVDIGSNFLTGTLSPKWGNAKSLLGLMVYNNSFSGKMPAEFGKLKLLNYLNIQQNEISGSILSDIGGLTDLKELMLSYNLFSGMIPTSIGNLTELEILQLNNNKLTNSLPEELFSFSNLSALYLQDNLFTGTLSTSIDHLSTLTRLILDGNEFHGEIPSQLSHLTKLQYLWLHYNSFTGTMPQSICQLRTGNDSLKELYADCLSGGSVTCSSTCCTDCCQKELQQCFQSQRYLI